jgi:signal transduction histidine kinase
MEALIQSPCRVLLADDTPEIRVLVRLALELEGGFEVVGEAGDGVEALHLSDEHQPDAVVIDLAMPVMDGLEAIPAIKKGNPKAKILVLSGFDEAQMKQEALRAGADAYLEKGESAHKIVQLLHRLCPRPDGSVREAPVGEAVAGADDLRLVDTEPDDVDVDPLSSLVHELMTPLTVVQGFAETMADRAESLTPDTIRQWADTIARNAGNMAAMIRSLRATTRVDAASVELDLEMVDLKAVVEETVADLGGLTSTRKVIVEPVVGLPLELHAERGKVRQILTNLLSNADKFSPSNTPIEIRLSRGTFYAEVSVRDHGRGIASDQLPQLFKKFSRLDAPEPGSGLGLYICRRLAREHGGDVVYMDADGGGANFCLRLPLPV